MINLSKYKILVVEDVESNFLFIEYVIRSNGGTVVWAKTGEEAILACKTHDDVHIILMDANLPGISGFEATQEIRKFNPKVPIIIITAFVNNESIMEAVQAGCNDYVAKPIKPDVVLSSLKKWLF